MFLAHSFRLRDPWQCEPASDVGVRWSRGFHRPTGLEADDDLWLVISGLPADATVTLNGQRLAPPDSDRPNAFHVTTLVAESNSIEIQIPSSPQPPTPSPRLSFPYDARLGVVGHS